MKGITENFKGINLKGMSFSEVLTLAKANNQTVKKAVLAVLLVICLLLFVFGGNEDEIAVEASSGASGDVAVVNGEAADLATSQSSDAYAGTLPAGEIFVDVQGAVESPGVVRLAEGARVFQAIEAAGGVVSMGDTSLLNLAQQLNDGDKLYVPFAGETVALPDGSQSLISGASDASGAGGKININTATSEELQTLSGIGIVTAGKIVDYRSKNGKFAKPEDIKNVSGIGDRTYDNIKDDICV